MTVKFENFYVDCSAYTLARLAQAFVQYMKGLGRSRVMFGTNWPMIEPARSLAGIDDLDLSPEAEESFLGGTAGRVFELPVPSPAS